MVPTTANEGYARLVREEWEDAIAALAELERERDRHAEVREIITSVVCGALNRAGINEVDNPGVAIDAIRNRAENAERERDELRVALSKRLNRSPTTTTTETQPCACAR